MIKKIKQLIFQHKIRSTVILIIAIIAAFYGFKFLSKSGQEPRYVLAAVQKGTIIASVSGSGQVSASDQLDVKSKASSDVLMVLVENGQEVGAGALIVQLDTKDAQKAVRDAEINLANAKTSLENLKNTKGKTGESLATAYKDGLNVLTNTFEDLSSGVSDLETIFTESSYRGDENDIDYYICLVRTYSKDSEPLSYWDSGAEDKYLTLKRQFDTVRASYFVLTVDSSRGQIENVLNQTYDVVQALLDLTRQAFNLIEKSRIVLETEDLILPISIETTNNQITQLSGFISSLVSRINSLSSSKQSIDDKKEAVEKADSDIEDQEYTIEQVEDALSDTKEELTQNYIRAPFDGIIAKINVKKGDSVSTNTAIATIITKQLIAEITLNEVDAAKAKVGQKATLTFDAIDGLNITGNVVEIDTLGTVSQNIVTYNVKITFNTQEEKVKPGMSVTADIITDAKQDVLVLPNSAIKSQGGSYYVELVEAPEETRQQLLGNRSGIILSTPLKTQLIETGFSNESLTEIISGLKESDIVVTSTISSNTTQTTQNQGFQIPGMTGGQMRTR